VKRTCSFGHVIPVGVTVCPLCPPRDTRSPSSRRTGRRDWTKLRQRVFAVYGTTCWICGQPGAGQVDHVIPVALGGSDDIANLRPAHGWCNNRRGAGSPRAA
jgi:5-methylcytosine-specific restriction endonuclease McrA